MSKNREPSAVRGVARRAKEHGTAQDAAAGGCEELTVRITWSVVGGSYAEAVEKRQTEALLRLLRWIVADARDPDAL